MALGHHLKRHNGLWPATLAALALWIFAMANSPGSRDEEQSMAMTARHFVENVMLSYDDSLRDKRAARLQHWLARYDSPEFVERLAWDLEKKAEMTDWLRVDLALVYHHFAQSTGEARWREAAFASLAHVKDQKGSYYFRQVDATLRGVPLSEADRADLAGYCATWLEDWWICQLAHAHDMDDRYDHSKIEGRGKRAGWQLLGSGTV